MVHSSIDIKVRVCEGFLAQRWTYQRHKVVRRQQGDQFCSGVARTGLGHRYKSRLVPKSVYEHTTLRRIYDAATICCSCWPVDNGENYILYLLASL